MSPAELPPLGFALALVLLGAPFLAVALRWASRRLPARPRAPFRWKSGEAAAVVASPFLLAALVGVVAGEAPPQAGEPRALLGILASQVVLGAAGGLAYALAARRADGRESLGFGTARPRGSFATVLGAYVPGFVVCVMGIGTTWSHVARARGWETEQEVVRLILGLDGAELVLAALVAVVVGPFLEELLFRGFLQGFLVQVVGERVALVLASALFASLHGLAGLPVLLLVSLFLGWLQLRTRCIWVPWSAHALHNGVMLGIALSVVTATGGSSG